MKKYNDLYYFISVLILTAGLVCSSGCASMKNSIIEQNIENYEVRVYEVFGMDCPGCVGGLNKLVEKIPSVARSEADWKGKQLVVTIKQGAQLDDADVRDAIKRANFTMGKRIK
jgi:copper chaperone CopZ